MEENRFKQQMRAFDHWKADIARTIQQFMHWLDSQQLGEAEISLRLYEAVETLRSDRLTIAFVAEFSRGKTELINAIFFSDYKRRLLPSDAGRTTMCPTELFYDTVEDEAYIRLLPIETRLEELSIADLKKDPSRWTTFPLDINAPDRMAETLQQVIKVKEVPRQDAERLGLYSAELSASMNGQGEPPATVEIPQWRHALISFPHPLLQQGLVVLDTPGLNALGNEPELTLSMLPNAQAVLFVLAADTGVTRSDLDMWQNHIRGCRGEARAGLVAALNKIDTLWDDIKNPAEVEATIESQRRETARSLGIEADKVFPVTAQKALLAKIRQDGDLLRRSRLLILESYLSDNIIPAKQAIVRDNMIGIAGSIFDGVRQSFLSRLKGVQSQADELRGMKDTNAEVLQHMVKKTRERQAAFNKKMEHFQSSRRVLAQQAKIIMDALSLVTFDRMMGDVRKDMEGSWSTAGLKKSMQTFFDNMRDTMQIVSRQADQTYAVAQTIYNKFYEDSNFNGTKPKMFSVKKYSEDFEKLYWEAEKFRNSPVTTMTEQSFVVKKFFISLGSHARYIVSQAHQEADNWLKDIMHPLVRYINEGKLQLEQQMETLNKVNESKEGLQEKLKELEAQTADIEAQLATLDEMDHALRMPIGEEVSQRQEPLSSVA
ncbi:MAG: dynamin family protein [Pseudomonadota bacterium]